MCRQERADVSVVEDFNTPVVDEFRANGGKVGGMFEGQPILLLHTTGAKTGRELVSPLGYYAKGARLLTMASNGGADRQPSWYFNVTAHPDVSVEVGAETLPMRATVLTGDERDRLYEEITAALPGYANYQQMTSRALPVIALDPR